MVLFLNLLFCGYLPPSLDPHRCDLFLIFVVCGRPPHFGVVVMSERYGR